MRIGLIGTGTIGTFLLDELNRKHSINDYHITAVFDERTKSEATLQEQARTYDFTYHSCIEQFLAEPIDVVVECANIAVVEKFARDIVKQKSLLIISIGALVSTNLLKDLQSLSKQSHKKVYLPSGAIGGLDVIRSAHVLNALDAVDLITTKPAHALTDEPIQQCTTLYSGPAKEAIQKFPKNANVAITLSMAGIGMEQTNVTIMADPEVTTNTHRVEATGDFGSLSLTLNNLPSPTNPKTSYLTSLSIVSALKSLNETITIC